ncbi:hypothetical protein Pme01_54570 [Planosporangium mesophilum]|uniref:Uncharacterized protein n=1 Tax=Planosporangium mesophilum TaxID=689768 RepID=A0A8J3TR87_9ACTN|nr:hypothetical protein Pme01_54570 [Planosporangium mesophilum]
MTSAVVFAVVTPTLPVTGTATSHTPGVALVNSTGNPDVALAEMLSVPAVTGVSAGFVKVIVCGVSPAARAGSAPVAAPDTAAASATAPTRAHLRLARKPTDRVLLIINHVPRLGAPHTGALQRASYFKKHKSVPERG